MQSLNKLPLKAVSDSLILTVQICKPAAVVILNNKKNPLTLKENVLGTLKRNSV